MYFQVSDAHHHHGGHTRTRRRVSGGSWDPHPKRVITTLQMRVVMSWGMQGQLGLTRHKVWIPTHYFFSIVFFSQSIHLRIWVWLYQKSVKVTTLVTIPGQKSKRPLLHLSTATTCSDWRVGAGPRGSNFQGRWLKSRSPNWTGESEINAQLSINAKISQHRFWPCHENELIKTNQTIPHNLYVSFKLTPLY